MAVAVQHLNNPPPALLERRSDLPKPLCDLVHKLLRKKPEDRYQSFTEVLEDIRSMSKAHKSGTITDVTIADADGHDGVPPARRLYGRRPWLTLTLLVLLTGSASAGVGWLIRTRIGPPSLAPAHIKPLPTAEAQFMQAMFLVNNEEAWKSVGKNFRNNPAEKVWVQRAEEQLLLLYLKDTSRQQEALEQITVLEGLRDDGPRFYPESRIAEAYVAAGVRDFTKAKSILSLDRTQFESELKGPWFRLYLDLQFQILGPPPGGPRPDGPRPGDPGSPPPGEAK